MSLYPKSLSPRFCPRAVCKPDKPLDIRRSLWAAPLKAMFRFQSHRLINSYLSQSPLKQLSHNTRGKEYSHRPRSPTRTEGLHTMGCDLVPQGDRSWHCCWLPQCHAAFGTIPSTLAWVDQCPVSYHVVVTLYRVSPPHLLPPPTWPRVRTPSMSRVAPLRAPPPHLLPSHITLRCGRGVGFMGGEIFVILVYHSVLQ
jgi:hypothetical protein